MSNCELILLRCLKMLEMRENFRKKRDIVKLHDKCSKPK